MNKSEAFDHNHHPNQESKKGFAPYASSTKVNFSANDARVEQYIDKPSLWMKVKRFFKNQ